MGFVCISIFKFKIWIWFKREKKSFIIFQFILEIEVQKMKDEGYKVSFIDFKIEFVFIIFRDFFKNI